MLFGYAVAGVPTKVAVGHLVLCNSFEENTLFATTPPVTETARDLAVDLVLSNGSRLNAGFTFEYRDNPVFTAIRPRNHLTVYAFICLFIYLFAHFATNKTVVTTTAILRPLYRSTCVSRHLL